eukprot:TRINITY_DN668038_c0_g1_i1.p1 TRINITY_DN668038_c0_g1~~TRINITY_DN668038_c0_g1_i1.p1  ORF type:complete len:233 (-),score=26.60 TRINITY_DN668038_c0_g1_i1:182-880(-)
MGLFYTVNCLLLTFAPLVIIYKNSSLSQNNEIKYIMKCIGLYGCARFIEIILMTMALEGESGEFELLQEIFSCSISLLTQIVAIHFALQGNRSKHVKILGCTVGFCAAHAIFSKLIPFYICAFRANEFSWDCILSAVDSNVNFISFYAIVSLYYMAMVKKASVFPWILITIIYFLEVACNFAMHSSLLNSTMESRLLSMDNLCLYGAYVIATFVVFILSKLCSCVCCSKKNN